MHTDYSWGIHVHLKSFIYTQEKGWITETNDQRFEAYDAVLWTNNFPYSQFLKSPSKLNMKSAVIEIHKNSEDDWIAMAALRSSCDEAELK